MKTEINIPILSNEKYSKEVLSDIISSLEKLDNAKMVVFSRLNNSLNERVAKLCSLKSRINRANQIIALIASKKEGFTLKSKRSYPNKNHNFYVPTVIDTNADKMEKEPMKKLNKVVLNKEIAGLNSKCTVVKENIVNYREFLSSSTQFNDIVKDLEKVCNKRDQVAEDLEQFQPMLANFTNDFTFLTKEKIELGKKNKTVTNVPDTNTDRPSLNKNTPQEEENKTRPVIQEAPISITQKAKIKKYRKRRKKLLSEGNAFQFNLPKSIALAGISEFDELKDEDDKINENNLEDEVEEFEEQEEIEEQDQPMDIIEEDFDLPLDHLKNQNKNKIESHKSVKTSINLTYNERRINNNNIEKNNNNNTVTSSVTSSSAVPPPPPPPPPPQEIPAPPKQNTSQPQRSKNPPPPPPPPPVPSSSKIEVIEGGAGIPPPPPPPPPPPVVPTVPSKTTNTQAEKRNGPEISLEEELARAKNGLKKKGNVKIEEKPKKVLSFQEQLAASRMKLKKKAQVEEPKPKPPVEEPKLSPQDVLKRQIQMRYEMIKKHEKEEEDDNEKSEDDDF